MEIMLEDRDLVLLNSVLSDCKGCLAKCNQVEQRQREELLTQIDRLMEILPRTVATVRSKCSSDD